ncbi:MAG: M14 family metallopeptidase [Ruminococcus sp.]
MKIEKIEVKEKEKYSGFLEVEGCGCELPVTVICGEPGETVLITAGVHNAEYVGIQAAIELAEEIMPEQVAGTVIIVPLVNVSGFIHRTASMVYEDGKNLNREFPGAAGGTTADRICHAVVTKLFSRADYYVDLHSGDCYEDLHSYAYYVGPADPEVRDKSFQMARRVKAGCLVESQCTTGGAYNYASSIGIPSILIERGGRGIWSREEVDLDKEDTRRILAYLGVLTDYKEKTEPVKQQIIFTDVVYENAPETGCWYPALCPGDFFKKGDVLGKVRDYFGNILHVCEAKENGMILYQTSSLNVLKDGPMVAYGILPEKEKNE